MDSRAFGFGKPAISLSELVKSSSTLSMSHKLSHSSRSGRCVSDLSRTSTQFLFILGPVAKSRIQARSVQFTHLHLSYPYHYYHEYFHTMHVPHILPTEQGLDRACVDEPLNYFFA